MAPKARRVTIYQDHRGRWRYRVQAGNWRVIDAPEQSFVRRASAEHRVEQRWPGVPVVYEQPAAA